MPKIKDNKIRAIQTATFLFTMLFFTSSLVGERISRDFNTNWRFQKGMQGPQAREMNFNDSLWQTVRLPHDWAISGPFNPTEHGSSGKLPWKGVGWYRKEFALDTTYLDCLVYLDFDGIMAFPKVYVNGQLAGQWDYGYTSFRVDITPYIKFDEQNILAIEVDTTNQGTRWYPGAGIYRKVTMTVCEPIHIAHWSTYVTTPQIDENSAEIHILSTIENHKTAEKNILVRFELQDPDGNSISQNEQAITLASKETQTVTQQFHIKKPQRWDITYPRLYTAKVSLLGEDSVLDTEIVNFGIRTFKFTADDGFHLNERRVQLYGVNLHHDHGPLGAAFYPRAMQRQLEIMRDLGVNAIRTSHNPPAPELLDLCDRMGFIVWDECFDKWDDKAGRVNGQPHLDKYGHKHIRNCVMRDRNHPSIVVWSIGNEILNQPDDPEGKSPERIKFMRGFVLKYDKTRPVSIACHIPQTAEQSILDAMDLTGWNYARRYEIYRNNYPDKPIIYSESASTLSTRGFYELPQPRTITDYSKTLQVSSYDLNAASWADIPDVEFQLMEQDDFVAGEFVWTGFDYLGEPTPFDQEARSSYFGIVDLCGIPKDRFYLYRSYWRPNETTIHILPHWNWPDRIGKEVPVFVYTNGDSAELFLNSKSLGKRTKGVAPAKPENYAYAKCPHVSSEQKEKGYIAANVTDASRETRWRADSGDVNQWLEIDLGAVCQIRSLNLEFEREAKNYGYEICVSENQADWQTIVTKPASNQPPWGGPKEDIHAVNTKGRHVKIIFNDLRNDVWAGICQFAIYPEKVESDYYIPTYHYRLRWNDIIYEPGQLKAVAYKGGKEIGTAVVRTAGKPASLRLTPDRNILAADGWDLSYVLVEALDAKGNLCPLADNLVNFKIKGPAEIAGVGNGNPMSFEPFQADYRRLFHGKAMLILRTMKKQTGSIQATANSEDLKSDTITLLAK